MIHDSSPRIPSLVYSSDEEPGISRVRRGRGFQYFLPDKSHLTCRAQLARIKSLGIPPAYTDVWICPKANGHIQATGYDAATRKQYRYHDQWRVYRDRQKFDQLAEFATTLPRIRRKVNALLTPGQDGDVPSKDVAIAALVRLIDRTAIRVGGSSRVSKGATTLDGGNVRYDDDIVRLRYRAKGGKKVSCSLRDTRLQKILEQIDDLPGKRLFQYVGSDGAVHPLDSGDVNDWLKEASGMDSLSAKMFRTWHGSVAALDAIASDESPTIKQACEAAAATLRNTPAICRKSYVHPAVLELIDMATEERLAMIESRSADITGLRVGENRFVGLIAGAR
ncbi:DNA topoisomerase IB [Parasphingorhabdus sp.]|uniref:DNA topoisomerase IB n=1 Tax=Parasphingorhabdus sp. TaxID=2709688 RepID=UPI003A917091